jgi:hypothetical protein
MQYPLDLRFKIATIGTRVRVTDAGGNLVAYVRKKKFRLKKTSASTRTRTRESSSSA